MAALAAAASLGSLITSTSTPAGADPQSATALVGVGSDTTQDVLNALAGFNNGINYVPIQSSAASGRKQLSSWDATANGAIKGCITPKAPGSTFDRPNGSTNGRKALSRALDSNPWVARPVAPDTVISGCSTAGGVDVGKAVNGLIDFARSSGGPSSTATTELTYLPFGRDAVSFGYYGNGVTPTTTLTTAQLQGLYTNPGPQTINGVSVVACLPQVGSGTRGFWLKALGNISDTTANAATAACNGTIQENDATALKNKGLTFPNTQVVIPFSAANFISQSNGVAASQLTAGVDLGAIDALGKPYTGTTPPLAPNPTFYANTVFGRDVYNVVDSLRVSGPAASNADIKTLLVGATSAICAAAAQSTVNAFGFLSISNCGSTAVQGVSITGDGTTN